MCNMLITCICVQCRGNQGNHGLVNWYSQNMTLEDITFYNPAGVYTEVDCATIASAQADVGSPAAGTPQAATRRFLDHDCLRNSK